MSKMNWHAASGVPAPAAAGAHGGPPRPGGDRVLLVDDDPVMRLLTVTALSERGWQVVEATGARKPSRRFARDHPQVVVLDAIMPQPDGFATCAQLRRLPGGEHVPVLMLLTGLDDELSVSRAYEAGATDFVVKSPGQWTLLSERLRYLLRAADTRADASVPRRELSALKLGRMALRYGLSASGPVSVSAAHFVASMLFLHILTRAEFGLFAFLLVIVPLCMSVSGALLGTSMATAITGAKTICEDQVGTHLKLNLLLSGIATLAVFGMMCTIGAPLLLAALLGAYGGAMTLRWFGRSFAYITTRPMRAVGSDLVYSMLLTTGLAALAATHALTAPHAAEMLFAAAALSVLAFGPEFLGRLFWPGKAGSLAGYGRLWHDITRWSLLGVMLTEMTANAHAYLVTLVSGPAAFALLALGALLMRPVSLVLTALPDMERPIMARAIVAGDRQRAFRSVKEFRTAAGAVWLLTILLSGALLLWFPHLILKQGYDETQAIVVVATWGAIQAVRTLRTPEAVLLQAAREYRPLAKVGMWSSIASLAATLALLLVAGPVASLGGVLIGELLMTANIFSLSKKWKRSHG